MDKEEETAGGTSWTRKRQQGEQGIESRRDKTDKEETAWGPGGQGRTY
jgi:hypothetical protein